MQDTGKRIIFPGYQVQLNEDSLWHSRTKLKESVQELIQKCNLNPSVMMELPCTSEKETLDYRCSCSFQLILDENHMYHYAMRTQGIPVRIGADFFPIATREIQQVMKIMIYNLNNDEQNQKLNLVRANLSSVSFVSSWNNDKDCIVTLNYSEKIHTKDVIFLNQLNDLRSVCNIKTLIARSKKVKVEIGCLSPSIEDDVLLSQDQNDIFHVSLVKAGDKYETQREEQTRRTIIHYSKPENAFQHPNGNTMIQALNWMLNTLSKIKYEIRTGTMEKLQLLEMYCGCGAHTMAISKANIFDNIIAVEMDQRLVDACIKNIQQNGCSPQKRDAIRTSTPVRVFQGDAGAFAAKSLSNKGSAIKTLSPDSKSYWQHQLFQVLLVDPPREGLDEQVMNLGMHCAFEHIIYISCGKDALVRDLNVLSSNFEVINCTLTDLFPRTDSVETLVHLRRRKR